MLKKEFKRKDVNRARNLIMGKSGDATGIQVGYKKKRIERKEGDIWTEREKTWTIKNGIKQTVSKLDKIKKEVFMPLCCPECNKVMKNHLDKPNYRIHKKCLKCVIEFEHKLKIKGKYNDYLKELQVKNKLTTLEQVEASLLDAVNSSNTGYVSEDGVIERWIGGIDKEKLSKDIKTYSKNIKKSLKEELND
jgi:hypothetical protein|tara:strand:- start:1099 stop:1674 length:576 start_codon:yes stop_codon:yes gene_type:complete